MMNAVALDAAFFTNANVNNTTNTNVAPIRTRMARKRRIRDDDADDPEWQQDEEAEQAESEEIQRDYIYTLHKRRRRLLPISIVPVSEQQRAYECGSDWKISSGQTSKEEKHVIETRDYRLRHPKADCRQLLRPPRYKRSPNAASCHKCKSSKSITVMIFCNRTHIHKKTKGEFTCRKKYCRKCLDRELIDFTDEERSKWICPACLGTCMCAKCVRDRGSYQELEMACLTLPVPPIPALLPMSILTLRIDNTDNDVLPLPSCISLVQQQHYHDHIPPLSPLTASSTSSTSLPRPVQDSFLPSPHAFTSSSSSSLVQEPLALAPPPLLQTLSENATSTVILDTSIPIVETTVAVLSSSETRTAFTDLAFGDAILDSTFPTLPRLEPIPEIVKWFDETSSLSTETPNTDHTLDGTRLNQKQKMHLSENADSMHYRITSACVNCRRLRIRCELVR